MSIDKGLIQFATVRQLEFIEAVEKHGTTRAAARALDISDGTIRNSLAGLKARAARQGYAPKHFENGVAPGYLMGKVTVQRGKAGDVERTWERQSPDAAAQEKMMRASIDAMSEEIPRLAAIPAPVSQTQSNLCNCYVITDYHLSMVSHHEETGDDNWDLKIAEQMLLGWFTQAISQAPAAETAVFAQLSDLLHADGIEPLTPSSKHVLDVDTRFYKVVRTVIRLLRQIIDMLLAKHPRVHIVMADANHDPVSQIWLREWIAVLYEKEPRITVDRSPSPYNMFEFGKVALFFHHGHKRRMGEVSDIFASKFREVYGRTRFAYAHMGHLHHVDVKENNLMIVEQHRTLAARDAYSARGGWLSGRDAKVITYHRDFGEVSRITINSDMLKGSEMLESA